MAEKRVGPLAAGGILPLLSDLARASRMKGLAVAYARGDRPIEAVFYGTDAAGRAIGGDTLFPVASVTKLATALAVLRLADSGVLGLDGPLARHLPEAGASGHYGVTVRRLLSHSAGLPLDLPAGMAPYAPGLDWPALADACIRTPLERQPGTRVQYSNVGYGLLAAIVERETGQGFGWVLRERVLDPLGIEGYLGDEPPRQPALVGGVRGQHARTYLEPYNSRFWRSLAMPWGGLVSTLDGALRLVRAFAGFPAGFLRPDLLAEAVRNQNGDLAGGFIPPLMWERCPWGLGPEIHDEKSPHWAPPEAAQDSFGHSGASGCVAWYDPAARLAWAIAGARTADSGWLVRHGPVIGAALLEGQS